MNDLEKFKEPIKYKDFVLAVRAHHEPEPPLNLFKISAFKIFEKLTPITREEALKLKPASYVMLPEQNEFHKIQQNVTEIFIVRQVDSNEDAVRLIADMKSEVDYFLENNSLSKTLEFKKELNRYSRE